MSPMSIPARPYELIRSRTSPAQAGRWTDDLALAGLGLAAALALWAVVVSVAATASPWGMLGALVLVAAAFAAGRLAAVHGIPVPGVIVGLAVLAIAVAPSATYGGGPTDGILGYANAKSAFFVQAFAAALVVALTVRSAGARWVGLVVAAAFASVPLASQSLGGTVAAAIIVVGGIMAWVGRLPRSAIAVFGALLALTLVTSVVLAAAFASHEPRTATLAVRRFGVQRAILWGEAYTLIREHPLLGVGPGRFAATSPMTRSDPDIRWAHNDFLQQMAETGIPGGILLALLFGWGFVRLGVSGSPLAVVGAASLAALGVHATVDYVLRFPLVPMTAAALVAATSQRHQARRAGADRFIGFTRRAAKAAVLPLGVRGRRREEDAVMLLYHRVGEGDREIDVPLSMFEEQMASLVERHLIVTIDEMLDGVGGVVLTFDDGLSDFHQRALPVLERNRIPAVLYLATGLVSKGEGQRGDGLTWSEVAEAVSTGLVTVGSHTHHHADLSSATESQAESEMRRSQGLIEERLGVPCRDFAYPWAVGSTAADRVARRLFRSAALHAWRTNRRGTVDRWQLGRTPVLRADGPFFFRAKVDGKLNWEALLYRLLRRGPWSRR